MAGPHQKTCVFVGDYEILGRLAAGGMAEILLARLDGTEGFEKQVALKRLLPKYARNPEYSAMFIEEARIMARLHHKNIVQIFDVAESGGIHYLVMEHLEGVDAKKIMNAHPEKRVPYGLALHIASNVCAGLHFAHELRDPKGRALEIVHRDISPANIVVTHAGGVKLIDFGIATARGREFETQTGIVKGTEAYMSPEQARCQLVDRRSDVYSLGVVLFEMTTGKLPTRNGRHHLAGRREVEPARMLVPDYPPELEAILLRSLAMSPDDRYPTAQALQDELEAFALQHGLTLSQEELGVTARSIAGEVAEIGSAPTVAIADSGKLLNASPSASVVVEEGPTAPAAPTPAPPSAPPIIASPIHAPAAAPRGAMAQVTPSGYVTPPGYAAAGFAPAHYTPPAVPAPPPPAYGGSPLAAYVSPAPAHHTPPQVMPQHTPAHHTPAPGMVAPRSAPPVSGAPAAAPMPVAGEGVSAAIPSPSRFIWIVSAVAVLLLTILILASTSGAKPEATVETTNYQAPVPESLGGAAPAETYATPPPLPTTYTPDPPLEAAPREVIPTPVSPAAAEELARFKRLQEIDDVSRPPVKSPVKRKGGRLKTSVARQGVVGRWDPKSPFLPGGR